MKLSDAVLPAAQEFAVRMAAQPRPLPLASERTERLQNVSPELFAAFRRKLAPKARGQLAPWKIIDSIEAAATLPKEEALQRERAAFIECRDSPQRKALVHVFFAEREARRIPGIAADLPTLPIRRAAVIGAGTMGGGIAMTFANAGTAGDRSRVVSREPRARPRPHPQALRRLGQPRESHERACRTRARAHPRRKRLRRARATPTSSSRRCSRTWQ